MEEGSLEQFLAIFLEPRNMELHDRAGPTIGRGKRLVAARSDIAVNRGFALTEDAARGVSRCRLAGVIEPLTIAGRDQYLGINTPKRFRVRVVNDGSVSTHLPQVSLTFGILSGRQ